MGSPSPPLKIGIYIYIYIYIYIICTVYTLAIESLHTYNNAIKLDFKAKYAC